MYHHSGSSQCTSPMHLVFLTLVSVSCSVRFNSLKSHGMYPARLLCSWNFPGKNTGLGSIPSPGDCPDPGKEPKYPTFQAGSLPFEPAGKPKTPQLFGLKKYFHMKNWDPQMSHN